MKKVYEDYLKRVNDPKEGANAQMKQTSIEGSPVSAIYALLMAMVVLVAFDFIGRSFGMYNKKPSK